MVSRAHPGLGAKHWPTSQHGVLISRSVHPSQAVNHHEASYYVYVPTLCVGHIWLYSERGVSWDSPSKCVARSATTRHRLSTLIHTCHLRLGRWKALTVAQSSQSACSAGSEGQPVRQCLDCAGLHVQTCAVVSHVCTCWQYYKALIFIPFSICRVQWSCTT